MSILKQIMPADGWYVKCKDKYTKLFAFGLFEHDETTTIDGIIDVEVSVPVSLLEDFDGLVYLPNETRQTWIEEPNKA